LRYFLAIRDDQTQVGAGKRSLGFFILRVDLLHPAKLLLQEIGLLEHQLLQTGEFLLGRQDVVGGHDLVDAGLDGLLELAHLLADALQFDLHRLDAAGPQAQLLQQGRDLAAVPAKVPGVGGRLGRVVARADALEELLIDLQKLGDRLEIGRAHV
jgi:hypothetical protein